VLTNLTVANNYAGKQGGGIFFYPFHPLTLTNTIVAGNTAPAGPDMYQYASGTENVSYSLIGDGTASGISGGTGNQIGTSSSPIDPKLTALGNYGGPTQTMALKTGSAAIGHGTSGSGIPTADQRGFARTGAYDIGAFQTQTSPFVVTTAADPGLISGALSLREAINLANALASSATITFDASFNSAQTIALNGQLPTITDPNLTITGPGQSLLTIDARHNDRVFVINSGVRAELDNMTVQNGGWLFQSGSNPFLNGSAPGGAIFNSGVLTINGCTLTGNVGADDFSTFGIRGGGAIYNDSGARMTINSCTLSNNTSGCPASTATGLGGAIQNRGQMTIVSSTITLNTASDFGGAIDNQGSLSITNNTLSGNTAYRGGGAIYDEGVLTISNGSTLNGNTALGNFGVNSNSGDGEGGGILIWYAGTGPNITLSNSTLSSNTATGSGGAIAIYGSSMTMTSCTVNGNTAYVYGGGMYVDPAVLTIVGSTFTGNTASAGADLYNLDTTVTVLASQISGIANNGGTVTDPIANLIAQVAALNLTQGVKNSLTSKLQAAEQSLESGNTTAALNQLEAFIHQVNALVNSDRLDQLTADYLDSAVDDLIQLLG
jgi:parallel beta-helix repeat protein